MTMFRDFDEPALSERHGPRMTAPDMTLSHLNVLRIFMRRSRPAANLCPLTRYFLPGHIDLLRIQQLEATHIRAAQGIRGNRPFPKPDLHSTLPPAGHACTSDLDIETA